MIGTLKEKSLHSGLKEWYARHGDLLEQLVDGFQIDIVRGDLLIEIQTGNFSSIKHKLSVLTETHPVRLVFPVSMERWIVRLSGSGKKKLGRRKSPRKGSLYHLFDELVYVAELMKKRRFCLEVLLIREEEVRRNDGRGSRWRNGWSIADRRLLDVVSRHDFSDPSDFLALVPENLHNPFSTHDLAGAVEQPLWLAQKMAYCLRRMGVIEAVGRNGNAILYATRPAIGNVISSSSCSR